MKAELIFHYFCLNGDCHHTDATDEPLMNDHCPECGSEMMMKLKYEPLKGLEFGERKQKAKATEEEINHAIMNDPVYTGVIRAYKNQIGYGIGKYPTTFGNAGWTTVECLKHLQQELCDALNYVEGAIQNLEKIEK
ncbi:hypothetical protein [Bacillus phage vB_BceS-M2]|nr:hypothetical protein PBC5_076 [Bacillus phage PBC5]